MKHNHQEFKVSGDELIKKVKQMIHEGNIPRIFRPMNDIDDTDEQLGITVQSRYDWETNANDWTSWNSGDWEPYFTWGGDNPIITDEATQADSKRSAGGWSDLSDRVADPGKRPSDYAHKRFTIAEQKTQKRNYWTVRNFIVARTGSWKALAAGWHRFQTRCAHEKAAFLSPWDQKILRQQWNEAFRNTQRK